MKLEEKIPKIMDNILHLDLIFGKWIVLLLLTLHHYGSTNFYQLHKEINRITPKVLSSKLKSLEKIGLIGKNILLEHPLRVEYYITKKGESFIENVIATFNLKSFSSNKN